MIIKLKRRTLAAFHYLVEFILIKRFSFSVNICCSFIENEYTGLECQCSCERYELPLTCRKRTPSFNDCFIVFIIKIAYKPVCIYIFSRNNLVICYIIIFTPDIALNTSNKKENTLQHLAYILS